MSITVFSSTGCVRCEIVKKYLTEKNISYTEHDIKTEAGNEGFKTFYKQNRSNILRDASGIFFPIIDDNGTIVQDAAVSLDWFMNKGALSGSITPNNLGHGWIGGLDISNISEKSHTSFMEILSRMKAGGLNIALACCGKNPDLLEKILQGKFVDRLAFNINANDFTITDKSLEDEFAKSVLIADTYQRFVKVKFFIDIAYKGNPIAHSIFEKVAQIMEKASNNNRLPVFLTNAENTSANIYAYRQAMGQWQTQTELKKRLY